jgi:hypothetical protein
MKQNAKVVIIGGSHSGFSCAWMLLNGPAAQKYQMKAPNANRKVQKQCSECCSCGVYLKQIKQQTGVNLQKKKPTAAENEKACACICKCFGVFRHDEWPADIVEKLPKNVQI